MSFNYHNKIFKPVSNSDTGEVSDATVFQYFQNGDLVHGIYQGGEIVYGTLIATVNRDGVLDMRYQHMNSKCELMTGKCISTPELLEDGRIRLHENWQWTCGDEESGTSIIEETER